MHLTLAILVDFSTIIITALMLDQGLKKRDDGVVNFHHAFGIIFLILVIFHRTYFVYRPTCLTNLRSRRVQAK